MTTDNERSQSFLKRYIRPSHLHDEILGLNVYDRGRLRLDQWSTQIPLAALSQEILDYIASLTNPIVDMLYAKIDRSTSGDGTAIVAASSGLKTKVVSYLIVAASDVNVVWVSGSTDISGAIPLTYNSGVAISGNSGNPVLETAVGEALYLNLDDDIAVTGHIAYFQEE